MSADFIIVGAGTAGCVLADGLTRRGARVLVLEAGGDDRHMHVQIPAAFAKLFKSKRDWAFTTAPQPALNGRRVFWPRGKMLGGSSAMNAQIHQWCAAADFEAWVARGAHGWGWSEMAPALARVDTALNGGALRDPNPLSYAFLESAANEGLLTRTAPTDGVLGASGWITDVAHRNGARWSAADAYLRPALRRGANVLKNALVERIVFSGTQATGVTIRRQGQQETLTAKRGVILAAGALGSPHLLMLSGVGPQAALRATGIDVRTDSLEVGANLQDHLMFVTHHKIDRPISLKSAESLMNLGRYLLAHRGMLASNVAEAIAFASSRPGGTIDLEFVFAPVLFENEGLTPPSAHGFSIAVVLLKPKSVGRISLGADHDLEIDPRYLSDTNGVDLTRLLAGAEMAQRIATQTPLARETTNVLTPRAWDADTVTKALRTTAHTIYHPVGTCRMGSDAASVVDTKLRVRGVNGLWVADASVMPEIPSGHPNAIVAAIADRACEMITS
jgi:choline dehydrogenase